MFFFGTDLQFLNPSEGDVSILIGENGSGKSQMLALLTKEYLGQSKKVFAISNSIHDKFPDSGRTFNF
jgi:ABC-type siderophore export system fused ATPase/permease subunit